MNSFLVGLAGPSCSGKTILARRVAERLPSETGVFPLDAYYRDLSALPPEVVETWNFDEPDALDFDLLAEHLRALARGDAVDQPIYDYVTHSRPWGTRRIEPKPYMILEGLFALHWKSVRDILDARVFVDAPDSLCLARRIARDTVERGSSKAEVREQFWRTVQPMCQKHVRPTRRWADLVVRGDRPILEGVEAVLDLILRHKW